MFKLVVLSVLLALAAARPSLVYSTAVVGSLPTSISHQSSAIVHNAALVAPVVHAAPLVTAYAAPALIGHGLLTLLSDAGRESDQNFNPFDGTEEIVALATVLYVSW
ncbi:hypothetical protein NQ315_001058 [Exocentrus adspersus]|uniref:Uncharacterized protein n=1 Tax=Exocentrus adspersus TaxID=1586481 RepID=A0AAV8WEN2_9CUCU|nr:hypothetical protein NQ315_001058 [Exocentrus adspersus]